MTERRAEIHGRYTAALRDVPGVDFMPVPSDSEPNHWLTVLTIDSSETGIDRERLRLALETENIEARPTWKPMHTQPLFADAEVVGGAVTEKLFDRGLCLPSGSGLTDADLDRVIDVIADCLS